MDIQLYAEEYGQGETLLLLHGNGESGEYFQKQISYFSRKYRVIAVDTRGHGKSPRGRAPFTIRQFAQDLKEFMDQKGIDRAHILGFSDGGNIALIFALKYPSRVNRLILNGANLEGRGVRASVQIPIILGYGLASVFAGVSKKAAGKAELLRLMVKDPNIKKECLGRIKNRTLVIAGTNDMIKEKHTRLIAKGIPHSTLVFIPGDHFIASKNPEAFNQAVDRFLSSPA